MVLVYVALVAAMMMMFGGFTWIGIIGVAATCFAYFVTAGD